MNKSFQLKAWQPLLRTCAACAVAVLTGCASGPRPEVPVQRFDAAMHAGSDKFAAGELQQAASAFEQAERIAALYDRRSLRVQALLSSGAVAATREQDAVALQSYQQALAEAQALSDAHGAGVALAGVADVQRRAGDAHGAQQSYERALLPTALREASTERLQARLGLALVWHLQGQTIAARDTLQALEDQARASKSPVLSGVLVNQAVLLRDAGDVAAAVAKAEEALELDRKASSPVALAADLELLAGLYRTAKRPVDAKASLERAQRIVQTTGQTKAAARLNALLQDLSLRQ